MEFTNHFLRVETQKLKFSEERIIQDPLKLVCRPSFYSMPRIKSQLLFLWENKECLHPQNSVERVRILVILTRRLELGLAELLHFIGSRRRKHHYNNVLRI